MGHDIADGAVPARMGPAFLCQERRIEHFREIFGAGIADQTDHALGLNLRAAIAQRGRQQRARGGAGEHSLRAQKLAGGGEAFRIRNHIGLGNEGEIGVGWHEILADAFHRPAPGLDHPAALDIGGEHRAFRIGQDHLRVR
jgi:hypothetical protein